MHHALPPEHINIPGEVQGNSGTFWPCPRSGQEVMHLAAGVSEDWGQNLPKFFAVTKSRKPSRFTERILPRFLPNFCTNFEGAAQESNVYPSFLPSGIGYQPLVGCNIEFRHWVRFL